LCERVAIVKAGRIVADSTLAKLRADAGYDLDVEWHDGLAPAIVPDWLKLVNTRRPGTHEKQGARWVARFVPTRDHTLSDMLALLAQHKDAIADVKLAQPDLETLFRRYYEDENAPQSQNGGGAA
jgi:ABC-type multidrug transport system ATPase subunit